MDNPPLTTLLWRGFIGRCPHCGQGALFYAYLKQNPACAQCGQDFTAFRAEDGPAWFTILLTGHIVIPVALSMARHDTDPGIGTLCFLIVLTLACVFILLPRSKGVFIAVLWLLARKKAQSLLALNSPEKIQS